MLSGRPDRRVTRRSGYRRDSRASRTALALEGVVAVLALVVLVALVSLVSADAGLCVAVLLTWGLGDVLFDARGVGSGRRRRRRPSYTG